MPCVDNLWERCTWEFQFVVPRYLEELDPLQQYDEASDLSPTIVVCSGDLVEQVGYTCFLHGSFYMNSIVFDRWRIHAVPTRRFSCFHKQCQPPFNTLLSQLALFTCTPYLLTAYLTRPRSNHSSTPFAFPATNSLLQHLLRLFVPL